VLIFAPWTPEQVKALNEYQEAGYVHPFMNDGVILIATPEGWVEKEGGPVTQTWAHDFMASDNWRLVCQETLLGMKR
jgi:hypothetical protein